MAKKYKETHAVSIWDIIVSSGELKKLIVNRCEELDIRLMHVVEEVGMNWATFRNNYLNNPNALSTPAVRAENIMDICELLGLKVKITIKIGEPDKETIFKLKNKKFKLPNGKRRKGKKGTFDPSE